MTTRALFGEGSYIIPKDGKEFFSGSSPPFPFERLISSLLHHGNGRGLECRMCEIIGDDCNAVDYNHQVPWVYEAKDLPHTLYRNEIVE